MPAPGAPRTQQHRHLFHVQIDGVTHAQFMECSELAAEFGEIVYREGGDFAATKDPGLYSVGDVTLSRGAVHNDSDLYEWFKEVGNYATGAGALTPVYKRTVDIVELDRDGVSILNRWRLYECWPKRFVAGDWAAEAEEKTIQSVVLSIKGFDQIQGI